MTPTEILRNALQELVQTADDNFDFAVEDSGEIKALEYARAVLDLTEESK